MPDKFGRLMFEFTGRARRYRSRENALLDEVSSLSERDSAILEFVYAKEEATFGEIAQELRLGGMARSSPSTISQAISALYAEHGLVEKRPNPKDQRQPIITLTEKGKATVEKMLNVRRKLLTTITEALELSEAEAAIFEAALVRGIKNLDKVLSEEQKEEQ